MEEKKFKTKTGFCHVLPDKIVLTRDGIIGNTSKVVVGNSIGRILVLYGFITIWLFYSSFNAFKNGQNFSSALFAIGGCFAAYSIYRSRNNSAAAVIERKQIRKVVFNKGLAGLTRPRFEIIFESEEGKVLKRLIMLPGSLSGEKSDIEKAVKVMQEENLLRD
ncbi:MAG: phosphoribosylaminoimidazolesuccinocarboxamide synthase [Bacteroidota bacterium]